MSMKHFRGGVDWALMVGLIFGAGTLAQAQEEEAKPDGVIQIGRPDAERSVPQLPPPDDRAFEAPNPAQPGLAAQPRYWVGVLFGDIGPDSALRAHVDIPEGQGLLVEQVMPNSPAEKAGLKRHDVLLRANDADLRDRQDLVESVLTEGEKGGQITLEILRRGQRETVYVTPQERPADAPVPPQPPGIGFGEGLGVFGEDALPRDFLRQLPFELRQFAPGVILGEPGRGVAVPDGFSISVLKDAGQPPRITVKRGEETWEIVGDDPEALNELPDDVRPFVERMLRDGTALGFRPGQPPLPEFGAEPLRERMERMEREMQELQERLLGPKDRPAEEPK